MTMSIHAPGMNLKIGSDNRSKGSFHGKYGPLVQKKSREIIVESIEMMIKNNDGSFPDSGDMFIEKITGQK